ncbi:LamG domain-containing protein [Catellatospora methionotrophica]|uniref:LamG domain-containing protein n=1 Tax=Catellatospora methionotrophica TaxID=121620 RepID=UPI00140C8C31|nr:LamG domain-containing protein [Catellatospora methionotrophica]
MSGTRVSGGRTGVVSALVAAVAATVVLVQPVAAAPPAPMPAAAVPAPDGRLSEAAALRQAQLTGQPVEVVSLRGESREVYALASGRMRMVQHAKPVRARTGGGWSAVDTTLTRVPGGGFAPAASTVDLVLSGGGDGPFVRMTRAGRSLALSWPQPLPAPTVAGDTVTYPEVLPGVDLRVRADVDGFAHLLVVKTPQAARQPALARVRLRVQAPDLTVSADAAGALRAVDRRSGQAVFEAPAPQMWDSGGTPAARAAAGALGMFRPAARAAVARVGVDVSRDELVLLPDAALLRADASRFPLVIDPVWKPVDSSANLMVSQRYNSYGFTGTEGVGFCDVSFDSECGSDNRKRIFYRLPIGAFAGKSILNAEFIAYETHAYDCDEGTSVQLWHASGFSSTSTWSSTADNWLTHLTSRDVAYCSRTPVEFGGTALRDVLRAAVARKDPAITLGLRAYSESTMAWWKRFAADADLRIEYNTPPPQPLMKNMSMSPGGACMDPANSPVVNQTPTFYAILHDADSGSAAKLYAEFSLTWTGGKWSSPRVGPKTTGSTFQVTPPVSLAGKTGLRWEVRTWDGNDYSPWSWIGGATSCYLRYDAGAPSAPAVSSAAYPRSNPDNPDDPWYDGVGRPGSFTLTTTDTDVTRYWVGVNTTPTAAGEYRPATAGGAVTVQLTPTRAGVNFLYVTALDAAGNASAPTAYLFRVRAGTEPRARWRLDEPAGATTVAAEVRTGTTPVTARVNTGAVLGVGGQVGTALRGNGTTGYAETTGPVIDTSKSFAVSAWAKLSSTNDFASVVSQDGTTVSGFYLHYSKVDNRWSFSQWNSDALPGFVRLLSSAPPVVGEWTHLVGVQDAVAKRSRLYVNGVLQQDKAVPLTFNATGPMAVGRGKYNGVKNEFFPGDLDDVQVFDRVVSTEEVSDLYRQHPVLAGRWKLNTDGADDSGKGRPLTPTGDARIDPAAGWLGSPPGALRLDGAGDYAATAGPVLATNRSFTVAGWVTAASRPTAKATVFSQAGTVNSGFALRYHPGLFDQAGGWQIEMPSTDTAAAVAQTAEHQEYQWQAQWDHIAVVYDAVAGVLQLYVNGWLEQTTDRVSARWNTIGFDATGPLQLGRAKVGGAWAEYWPGLVDDVWAFSGVLSQEQVQALAGYTELPSASPF